MKLPIFACLNLAVPILCRLDAETREACASGSSCDAARGDTMMQVHLQNAKVLMSEEEKRRGNTTKQAPLFKSSTKGETFPVDTMPLSCTGFVKVPSDFGTGRVGIVVGSYPNANNINCEIHTSGKPRLWWNNGKATDWKPDIDLRTGTWTHYAFVVNEGRTQAKFYKDGALMDTKNADFGTPVPSGTMKIGGDHRSGDTKAFQAQLKCVSIFDKELSAGTISQMASGVENCEADDSDGEPCVDEDSEEQCQHYWENGCGFKGELLCKKTCGICGDGAPAKAPDSYSDTWTADGDTWTADSVGGPCVDQETEEQCQHYLENGCGFKGELLCKKTCGICGDGAPGKAPAAKEPCSGDSGTFNTGWGAGDCKSYGSGQENDGYCSDQDVDSGMTAASVCSECGECV